MKKIFIVFPFILSLLFPFVVPLRSNAALSTDSEGYLYLYSGTDVPYLSFFFDDSSGKRCTMYWYDNYLQPDDFTVTESNGSFWIKSKHATLDFTAGFYDIGASDIDDVDFRRDYKTQISDIEIDASGVLNLYRYSAGSPDEHEETPSFTVSVSENNLHGISSSLFEFAGFDDSLHIDVVFNPSLSGNVDRSVTTSAAHLNLPEAEEAPPSFYNETTFISESFTMYVNNNSRSAVQIFFAIVPHGDSFRFASAGDTDLGLVGCTYEYDVPTYVWWDVSWNFMFDQTIAPEDSPTVTNYYSYTSSKNYAPCPWHYLAAGSSFSQSFNWSEMDLDKNSEYDVLVYAVKCPYDVPSRQCLFSDDDYYIDLSSSELVYNSTFRAVNPVPFDVESGGNHVLWHNNSGYVDSAWTSVAHLDENGNTVIEGRDLNHFNKARSDLTGQAWDDVHSSYVERVEANRSNANFSNLLSQSKNYFSFVVSVFNFFPSYVNLAFCFGFWSLVFFAFIRRL